MLECVPNVSEGRDASVVERLATVIRDAGAELLDAHRDSDHHRSVFTFVGARAVVARAALALGGAAIRSVDLRRHAGVHPRVGALDVMPFVPLRGSSMHDAVDTAHAVGRGLAKEHDIPVFFYGDAALVPERRELPSIRAGGLEGLQRRLVAGAWTADAGPTRLHPTAGAAIVGARRVLIAFNAVLTTPDVRVAARIARAIRESSGGLPAVRAIGVSLATRSLAQVSMNLLDYQRTPVSLVAERLETEALRAGTDVVEYELVGCAPADAFPRPLARPIAGLRPSQLLDPALFAGV
ncbi:MAG: glutamate formimidoyltransferase [Candidatus Rokubacteria bacterium]|nr:glutamate formimidoyltransferase [Candidatus Rokubacteria bacterium]